MLEGIFVCTAVTGARRIPDTRGRALGPWGAGRRAGRL